MTISTRTTAEGSSDRRRGCFRPPEHLDPEPAGGRPLGQDACMDIRAVAFDANGTLVRIQTEDGAEEIFRAAAHFLTYQGIDLCRDQVRDLYFRFMAEQRDASPEEHPEFDAVGIWRR